MERWKALTDLNFNHLEISNTGRLRNSETSHVYKLRMQKQTGLSFCDVSVIDQNSVLQRKTIYIAREVCEAFVKKPADFTAHLYKAAHKKGVSKLSNLAANLCWKTQSEFSKENMVKYPENRNTLAEFNKKKFAKIRNKLEQEDKVPQTLKPIKSFVLKEIAINKLKENDEFKLSLSKIKFHVFKKIVHLGDNVPSLYKGKSLIIRKDCRQIVVNQNENCYLKTY